MYAEWIHSSNGLPHEGQQVEFLLERRSVALEGSYTHQAFRSHWVEYAISRVRSWRNLTQQCDLAIPVWNQAERVLSNASSHETSHYPLPEGGLAHAA